MSYNEYILGSAEVVGLMCLHVFTEGNQEMYDHLKPSAMKLGAAFQKVNFLRDMKEDYTALGRTYFPGVDMKQFSHADKLRIEKEIEEDFAEAFGRHQAITRQLSIWSICSMCVLHEAICKNKIATPSKHYDRANQNTEL